MIYIFIFNNYYMFVENVVSFKKKLSYSQSHGTKTAPEELRLFIIITLFTTMGKWSE